MNQKQNQKQAPTLSTGIAKWNGPPSPLWKLNPQLIKQALKAYQAGEAAHSVAIRLGVTLNAIRYHAKKAGIWQGRRLENIEIRFWNKVNKTDACWNWTGAKFYRGYGCFRLNGQSVLAHRVAYELVHGPTPMGLVIDHLCRNTLCVNPDHLEPVTNAENVRRGMVLKGKKYTLKTRKNRRSQCK